jgi:hypothetical protein
VGAAREEHVNRPPVVVSIVYVGLGAALWYLTASLGGRREAWDSPLYGRLVLPALVVLPGIAGYLFPRQPKRWSYLLCGGQALAAFVADPAATLLPLGLALFAIMGAFFSLAGLAGAALRRRVRRGEG